MSGLGNQPARANHTTYLGYLQMSQFTYGLRELKKRSNGNLRTSVVQLRCNTLGKQCKGPRPFNFTENMCTYGFMQIQSN